MVEFDTNNKININEKNITNINNIIYIDIKINKSKGALYQDERKCNPW